MRSSAPVRAALCAAALISLTAAFGLHPEPSHSGASKTAGLAAKATLQAPAHDCVACLNSGSALAATDAGLAPAAADSVPAFFDRAAGPPSSLHCRSLSGRSPPLGLSL